MRYIAKRLSALTVNQMLAVAIAWRLLVAVVFGAALVQCAGAL